MSHHVLVVDDDPGIRDVIAEMLRDEGYDVTTASNGREALEAITTQPLAVVLLDLNMPVMDGWQVTAEVQQRGLHVPLVFMTAGQRAQAEAERWHVDGYLPKPFDFGKLIDTVAQFAGPPPS